MAGESQKEMTYKKIIWMSPVTRPGRDIWEVMQDYMAELGWEMHPYDFEGAQFIFSCSESQIEKAITVKSKTNLPIICWCWGFPYFRLQQSEVWARYYLNKIELLKGCHGLLVPSQLGAVQLADWFLRGTIFEPGVDDKLITSIPEQHVERQIIYVGGLVPHKRIDMIINALSMIQDQPIKLVIVGIGTEKQNLIKLAETRKVELEIKSDLDDRNKIIEIKRSIALVSASEYEGFGMPPMEAAWAGRPALIRDNIFWRINYKDGFLYFSDEHELARLIVSLHSDSKLYQEALEHQNRIKSLYSMTKFAKRLDMGFGAYVSSLVKRDLGNTASKATTLAQMKEVYEGNTQRELDFHKDDFGENAPDFWRADAVIKEFIPGIILDVGCGHGVFSVKFAKAGFKVKAVDISPSFLEFAREHTKKMGFEIEFSEAPAEELPFKDETFDNVWIGEVIEHVIDPKVAISSALRVIKKGGRLVGTTPFEKSFPSELHIHEFSIEELRKILLGIENCKILKLETLSNPELSNRRHLLFVVEKV